jgi:hypothetical protein
VIILGNVLHNRAPPTAAKNLSLYLLNADYRVTSLVLRSDAGLPAGRVDVIGELRDMVPLPWLACFKAADLVACHIELTDDDGSQRRDELLLPCTHIESALINLIRARPFFERLTNEKTLADEYWQRAVARLKRYKRPYLAIDYAGLLDLSTIEELNAASRAALSWSEEGLAALTEEFLAWAPGVRPLAPSQLDDAPVSDAFLNGMSLDVNDLGPDSVWGIGE